METVKIDPWGAHVGGNQHSTVWPEVGGNLPRQYTAKQPLSTGALHIRKTYFYCIQPGIRL